MHPAYVLQDIDRGDKDVWSDMSQLREQIQEAVRFCFPSKPEAVDKYVISVTEMEVRAGAFDNRNSRNQVSFILRDLAGIDSELHMSRRLIDMDESRIVNSAQDKLKTFKTESVPNNVSDELICCINYDKATVNATKELIKRMCDEVCKRLLFQIFVGFEKNKKYAISPTFAEVLSHLEIAKEKRKNFIGREDLLEHVCGYISETSGDPAKPLFLHGESGCGKTSVMAMAALKAKEMCPKNVVITRFIGTTSASGSIQDLLKSVCEQIAHVYNVVTKVPDNIILLNKHFRFCLGLANNDAPMVIILDSLDQLSTDDNARQLVWLKLDTNLPPFVKIVLSAIPGHTSDVTKILPNDNVILVRSLSQTEGPVILREMMKSSNRKLTDEQTRRVIQLFTNCPLPLYLRLVVDVASSWKSYDSADSVIIGNDVRRMIELLFERLERKYGHTFISYALGYITASKNGLSQAELEDILSCNDKVLDELYKFWTPPMRRIPPLLWARVRWDISEYLTERGSGGEVLYHWYHRQFFEVAANRYLHLSHSKSGVENRLHDLHLDIADYFDGKWVNGKQRNNKNQSEQGDMSVYGRGIPEQPIVISGNRGEGGRLNKRKLSELPYHLIKVCDWTRLKGLALNLPFLEAKFEAGMGHDSYSELLQAARLSRDESLRKVALFLGQNISFLSREPEAIYQLVSQQPMSHPLAHALSIMEQNGTVPRFIRQYSSANTQDELCMLTVQGHTEEIRSIAFSPKGSSTFFLIC